TRILTLSGFIYDIGKLKLPNSLLWTPGRLSNDEYTRMQTHTILGYDLIKHKELDEHIINATLMHHERCDGSGYPNHLKDEEIDLFAKYMGIVDSYEAMTSARTYRPSLHPFEVIKNFEVGGLERYGTPLILPILQHIANSHLGHRVSLSNGEAADIILINNHALTKPLVKCVDSGQLLDMSKTPNIEITGML
ncbi:MAG: HD domain-containing protein, partial [Lachnospiraceae bacterium]|nr:HD domain-containing protein [Lachnospiraceae bacterium]